MKPTPEQMRDLLAAFAPMKGQFPFRLGTTSYIYPGEILPNVELLADCIDEIQLLLFEGHSYSNIPNRETIERLNEIASEKQITYSIHLPLDIYPGHEEESVRKESVRTIESIYRVGRELNCETFVFHYANRNPNGRSFRSLRTWRERLCRSTEELIALGISSQHLCVENLSYPFSWVSDLVDQYRLSKCIDIGHLRVHSFPVQSHLKNHLPDSKIVHLHGLKNGVDHKGLSHRDGRSIRQLFRKIEEFQYRGSVILEVFQLTHLLESLQTFQHYWKRWQKEKSY